MSITIRQGNDLDIPMELKDGAIVLDYTGGTIELMVKNSVADADAAADIVKSSSDAAEITTSDPTNGLFTVHFIPADTVSLTASNEDTNYIYDIRVITAAAKEYNTETEPFTISRVVNRQGS